MNAEYDELIQHLKGIREIVINVCHGGFELSYKARLLYLNLSLIEYTTQDQVSRDETEKFGPIIIVNGEEWENRDLRRDDPVLITVVKSLGPESWGRFSKLKIVKIPDNIGWEIEETNGYEWVSEAHRRWY
jgi:hypothetical protein